MNAFLQLSVLRHLKCIPWMQTSPAVNFTLFHSNMHVGRFLWLAPAFSLGNSCMTSACLWLSVLEHETSQTWDILMIALFSTACHKLNAELSTWLQFSIWWLLYFGEHFMCTNCADSLCMSKHTLCTLTAHVVRAQYAMNVPIDNNTGIWWVRVNVVVTPHWVDLSLNASLYSELSLIHFGELCIS